MRKKRRDNRPAFLSASRDSAAMFAELLAADIAAIDRRTDRDGWTATSTVEDGDPIAAVEEN